MRVKKAHRLDPLSTRRGLLRGQFASVVHALRSARLDDAAAVVAASNLTKVAARD